MSDEYDLNRYLSSDVFVRDVKTSTELPLASSYPFFQGASVVSWLDLRGLHWNKALVKDHKVIFLDFRNTARLTLGDAIELLGPPERYIAFLGGINADTHLAVYYPSKGLGLELIDKWARTLQLRPGLGIDTINYFPPTTPEAMLEFIPLLPVYANKRCTTENWRTWNGYVDIDVLPHELGCKP